MTIKEVLQAHIQALGDIRLPVMEQEATNRIANAVHDMIACVRAIEADEARRACAKSEPGPEETPEETTEEITEEGGQEEHEDS